MGECKVFRHSWLRLARRFICRRWSGASNTFRLQAARMKELSNVGAEMMSGRRASAHGSGA